MGAFVKVGQVGDFREARGVVVRLDETKVAVFRIGDRWHAIQDSCPHMGASLGDGRVKDGRVECHWHGWTFDLLSGQGSMKSKQWLCAKIYEVRVDGEDVYVRRPDPPPPPPEKDNDWVPWDPKFLKKKT